MPKGLLLTIGLAAAFAAQGQDPPALAAIRDYAESYVHGLPDYTCVQETSRLFSQAGRPQADEIEEELSFVGGAEHYKVLKVNGQPSNISHQQLGIFSQGEFGGLLGHIFAPASATSFRAAPPSKIDGRAMNVIGYRVPVQTGYIVTDAESNRSLVVAYEGSVWADADTNAVRKLTVKLVNFPKTTRLESTEVTMEYKPTDISGQQFILPSQFDWNWRKGARNGLPRQEGDSRVVYKSCRKFTTESNISFGN